MSKKVKKEKKVTKNFLKVLPEPIIKKEKVKKLKGLPFFHSNQVGYCAVCHSLLEYTKRGWCCSNDECTHYARSN
jgi:hypothetical protein